MSDEVLLPRSDAIAMIKAALLIEQNGGGSAAIVKIRWMLKDWPEDLEAIVLAEVRDEARAVLVKLQEALKEGD